MSGPARRSRFASRLAIGLGIVSVVVLAAFAVGKTRAYTIPSGSMTPTLMPGDYYFAGPAPAIDQLARGDVVVVSHPERPRVRYVHRLIGLPGDRVAVVGGAPVINGRPARREPIEDLELPLEDRPGVQRCRERDAARGVCVLSQFIETLPDGARYPVVDIDGPTGVMDSMPEITVPAGRVFLLGDHRDNAADSRAPETRGGYGTPPVASILNQNGVVVFSTRRSGRYLLPVAPERP